MPHKFSPFEKNSSVSFEKFFQPAIDAMTGMQPLLARGDRPLQMGFEDHLKALVFYHLEDHTSAQHLLQVLQEDNFARNNIAPQGGIKKSSFSEATNSRGLDQFLHVFNSLQPMASKMTANSCPELGRLTAIDGSLIDATLTMYWADYRKGCKKAKAHVGFDINNSIPRKIFLTDGKGGERPFVSRIISEGETGVMDRGYQCHQQFDAWQDDNKYFICRIKAGTQKTIVKANEIDPEGIVFFDAVALLGTPGANETRNTLRLVGYEINRVKYWIATNRHDLSAEQIAMAYKLRWDIENFFAWWKRHLRVYHLIARSWHGLLVQLLCGLITYLLLAIYCHSEHGEKVSIKRLRQLRIQIQNELRSINHAAQFKCGERERGINLAKAKT